MGGKGLEQDLGHRFRRPQLLRQALTHPSVAQTPIERAATYERLEFLGDRVLGLVIAGLLFETFPDEPEGDLSPRFTKLVRREGLARVAAGIGLGAHVILSRGEEDTGGRRNPGILADALEAVIAALYLDGGLEAADRFIRRHWRELMAEDSVPPMDSKTRLQEWAQARGLPLPEYRETERQGPSHAPVFTVRVSLPGREPASATGLSKRAAEQEAAGAMLAGIQETGDRP